MAGRPTSPVSAPTLDPTRASPCCLRGGGERLRLSELTKLSNAHLSYIESIVVQNHTLICQGLSWACQTQLMANPVMPAAIWQKLGSLI